MLWIKMNPSERDYEERSNSISSQARITEKTNKNYSQLDASLDPPFITLNYCFEGYEGSPSQASISSNPTTVIQWNSPHNSLSRRSRSQRKPLTLNSPFNHRQHREPTIPIGTGRFSDESRTTSPENHANSPQYEFTSSGLSSRLPSHQETYTDSGEIISTSRKGTLASEMSYLEASSHTSIDETSHIRFAIEQLTRTEDLQKDDIRLYTPICRPEHSAMNPVTYENDKDHVRPTRERKITTVSHYSKNRPYEDTFSDLNLPYMTPEKEREGMALTRKYRSPPVAGRSFSLYPVPIPESTINISEPHLIPSTVLNSTSLIPIDAPNSKKHPRLTFVPRILRLPSILMLSFICLIMIVLLIFYAIQSRRHNYLAEFEDMSGRKYFLLKFGPQILACFIFIYVQCVISTITRIMPFTILKMNTSVTSRSNAFHTRIYPVMLRPMRVGNIHMDICLSIFWLSIFTIPLQSSLISTDLTKTGQHEKTVQSVAWALVMFYTLTIIAALISGIFFYRRVTGLKWDPRSLADIMAMLPNSNILRDFQGTDTLKSKNEIRQCLGERSYRLGYWKSAHDSTRIHYCFGEGSKSPTPAPKTDRKQGHASDLTREQFTDAESTIPRHDVGTRYRFISWYLRDTAVIIWSVLGFIFWLDLILIFFLPMTANQRGFLQSINSSVNSSGFSLVSFWISFVPSLFGMILYLLFQQLDMKLRILKPWSELSSAQGSTADESILLDYPAELPIQSSLSALSAGHYRICITSLLSAIFILLPVSLGSLFYPIAILPSREMKIVKDTSILAILIILFSLYFLGLLILTHKADRMYLPHDVSCLSEIISFCFNSHFVRDAAFHEASSKVELATRLLAEKTDFRADVGLVSGDYGPNRWAFGVYRGTDGKDSLGIERVGRSPGVGLMVMSAR